MTREEYLQELNKAFGDFKFFEEDHHYEYKGQRVGISVTTFYPQYENEFDAEAVAEKIAIRDNKSIQEILDEWEYKKNFACEKGSTIHEYIQSLFNGNEYKKILFDNSKEYLEAVDKCQKQADNFYKDYKDRLEHIADEYTIGSECYDIASNIDHLFRNKLTGGLVLVDYKTNKELTGYNKQAYKKPMKVPLQNINDDKIHHYYIQLSIYRYLVEKYTNLKIEEMFIVYFSENIENYEIIEIPYLKKEVEEILENRRVKNMKSIPVMIMGASGSGKSFSLRNLPPEETGIISVAKSELPFRNKTGLKFTECDDYSMIEQIIQKTDKRIIVIDDTGYLMQFENFEKAMIKGYDKHTEMAKHYADLFNVVRKLKGEKIVYLTIHEDIIEGVAKPKTTGKMINDCLCIEGLLNIVLRSLVKDGEHVFQTRNSGDSVAKTPYEMFEEEFIPNDLAEVDRVIREYYGFKPIENKESEEK